MLKHLLISSTMSFVISLLSLIVTARIFPLEFIADFKAATLYSGLISTILTFQFHSSLLYFTGKNNNTYIKDDIKILTLQILFTLATFSSIIFFFLFPLLYDAMGLNKSGLILFSIFTFFNFLFVVSPAIYAAFTFVNKLTIFMLGYALSSLLSLLITYFLSKDINFYITLNITLLFLVFIFSKWFSLVKLLCVNGFKCNIHGKTKFFLFAKKISISSFFDTMSDKIDKIFVAKIFTAKQFANYSVLCFENPLINILLNSYGIKILNQFGTDALVDWEEFKKSWDRLNKNIVTITYPIAALLFFNSNWFISFLFGPRYTEYEMIFCIYTLVALVRPAPFQILLKMIGEVSFSIIISATFLFASIVTLSLLYFFEMDVIYYPLAYFIGWFCFNIFAIYFFSKKQGVSYFSICLYDVYLPRIIFCFTSCYFYYYVFDADPILGGSAFTITYAVFIYYVDKTFLTMLVTYYRENYS